LFVSPANFGRVTSTLDFVQRPRSCSQRGRRRRNRRVVGLALGIVVRVTTSEPLAPELGAVLGGLFGWLSRRERR
jgi:hypothetical protein